MLLQNRRLETPKGAGESVLEQTATGLKDRLDCACLANFQRMCLFYISETVWGLFVRFYFIFLNTALVTFLAGQAGLELMEILLH